MQFPACFHIQLPERVVRLLAWTAGLVMPLFFAAILWMHHANTQAGKGADFAYQNRIALWTWISQWSLQGSPPLAGRMRADGPFFPVEAVYTDDMGFSLLVDWMTRLTGKKLGRNDFFHIIVALNIALLWVFVGSLARWPAVMLLASVLILFPSFSIPREAIGPDLFSLYGSLSLVCVTPSILGVHGRGRAAWVGAGVLVGAVFLLRQAVGMIMIFVLGVSLIDWLGTPANRTLRAGRRWFYVAAGVGVVWMGFHGLLAWRDFQIGANPGENRGPNRGPKCHTMFHALYLGIGNIKDNPWGIVYADKFAYDQILNPEEMKNAYVYSAKYLSGVRKLYLDLWKKDGVRLLKCYARHFVFVVGTTLGWISFLAGAGGVALVGIRRFRSSGGVDIFETCIVALAATLGAFLIQSTLIDWHAMFSYPTELLGRYLLAFCAAALLRRACRTVPSSSGEKSNPEISSSQPPA